MAVGSSTPYLGYDAYLAIAQEETFGTRVTGTTFLEFNSESLNRETETKKLDSINTTRNPQKQVSLNQTISGTIEVDANPGADGFAILCGHALGGTMASSTLAAGAIAHTLWEGNMELNSPTTTATNAVALTAQVRKGGTDQFSFAGMRVNALTISGEVGDVVKASFDLMGKSGTSTSDALTPAFTTINPCNFDGITIQTSDSIGGSWTTEVFESFEVSVENNLTEQRGLGSVNLHALPPGMRTVGLKLTQQYDTLTAYNRYTQATSVAMQIIMDTGVTLTAAQSTYSMAIRFPKVYIKNPMPDVGGPDPIALEFETDVMGLQGTTTGYAIQMQINNATATYEIT